MASSSSSATRRRQRLRLRGETNTLLTFSFSADLVLSNDDLLREILIRLPAKPLYQFKLVSKRWSSIISNHQLLTDWKIPKSPSSLFFRRHSSPFAPNIKFNYIPLLPSPNTNKSKKKSPLRSLDFVNEPSGVKINHSCKGLLLCSSTGMILDYVGVRYYVHNPTNKDFTRIPRPTNDEKTIVAMNLAFDPSLSFDYKIVAVVCELSYDVSCQIHVYSSVSRTWIPSREMWFNCGSNCTVIFENGVFLNDKMHWPSYRSKTCIYYDFSLDKTVSMPMPNHHCRDRGLMHFMESRGRLQYVDLTYQIEFDVFEMERDCSSWFVRYHVDLGVSWSSLRGYLSVQVLCFVGGEGEGDSSLFFYTPGEVISYNLKDKTFTKVCELKLRQCDIQNLQLRPWLTIHPFMETPFLV